MKKILLSVAVFAAFGASAQDTITAHMNLVDDAPTIYGAQGGDMFRGTNSYGDLTKMMLFDGTHGVNGGGVINSVLLWAPVKADAGGSFQVAIWSDNNGTPNPTPIGVVSCTLASLDTSAAALAPANGNTVYNFTATFSTPVTIPAGNKFWAGVVLPTTAANGDTLALVSSTDGDYPDAVTHTGEYQGDLSFHTFDDGSQASWGLDLALAIYPVVTISAPVGLNENAISASVYPNPASDVLNIKSTEGIASVTITSMDGKVVATANTASVSVSHLNAGMYLYTATTTTGKVANGNFVKK